MENGVFQSEAMMQEMVFLGHIYTNPKQFKVYADVMSSSDVFTTSVPKAIWEATVKYFMEYGRIPNSNEVIASVLDSKLLDPLRIAIDFVTNDNEDASKYLHDKFVDSLKLTLMRNHLSILDLQLNSGMANVNKAMEETYKLQSKVLKLDTVGSLHGMSAENSLIELWMNNELPTQQPLHPIPIPGIEEYIAGTPTQQINFIISHFGGGKALPKDMIVPTPTGDRLWGSIEVGDQLIGCNGKPTTVLGVYDQGIQDIYKITFDTEETIECTGDHLWEVYDHEFEEVVVLSTSQIIKNGLWKIKTTPRLFNRWSLPLISPIRYCTGLMRVPKGMEDDVDYIYAEADIDDIISWIDSYENIYIPCRYMYAPILIRNNLINNLLRIRGSFVTKEQKKLITWKNAEYVICSNNLTTAENLVQLIKSIGGLAVLLPQTWGTKDFEKTDYMVFLTIPKAVSPHKKIKFIPVRYIKTIHKTGLKKSCMCVKVDANDSLYLANNFIPTHNTTALCQLAAGMLNHSPGLYVTLEMPAANILFKILASATNGVVDTNLAFALSDDETKVSDLVKQSVINFWNDRARNRLFFLDMPANSIRAATIDREILRIKMEYGIDIKWLCIDYADLLITNTGKGISDDGFSYMISVMGDIQAVCKSKDIVGWTASQTSKGFSTSVEDPTAFKPVRSKDLWGSDAKMQVGNLGLGLAVHRIAEHKRYGIGALSVIKDRFQTGKGARDLIIEVDYASSIINVVGEAPEGMIWADKIYEYSNQLNAALAAQMTGRKTKAMLQLSKQAQTQAVVQSVVSGVTNKIATQSMRNKINTQTIL